MNRRELLKSLPIVAAITPITIKTIQNGKETETTQAFPLEDGAFYLFVLNPASADSGDLIQSLQGGDCRIRGAIVYAKDCDVDNFCRIYKLDEK